MNNEPSFIEHGLAFPWSPVILPSSRAISYLYLLRLKQALGTTGLHEWVAVTAFQLASYPRSRPCLCRPLCRQAGE